jgi:flagellar protein FlaJ
MGDDDQPPDAGEGTASAGGHGADAEGTDGTDPARDEDEYWARYGEHPEQEAEPAAEFQAGYGGNQQTERALQGQEPAAGLRDLSRADLREHYGPFRTLFKQREGVYTGFQRRLQQARVGETFDQYLARLVRRMAYIVAASAVVSVIAGLSVLVLGPGSLPGPLATQALSGPALAGVTLALCVGAGLLGVGLYWVWHRVLKLRLRVAGRRRDIAYNLPYAVTFMFALSRAGVGFDRVVTRLADSTETYGAAAEEFDRVVRDVEMFGNDIYTGLENLRTVTPSDELRRVADDITVVLETGGDLAEYLHDEIDDQLENAVAEQESFIEQLELLSEVFVVGFVAAPLFVLVVLLVVAFLGAGTLTAMAAVVYVVVPLGLVGFYVLVDAVSGPFKERAVSFTPGRQSGSPPPAGEDDPEWRAAYERAREHTSFRDRVRETVAGVGDEPWRVFLFSVPVAALLPVVAVLAGVAAPTLPALVADPVGVTTALAVVPVLVAVTPVAVVHEYRRRQERALQERFPALLEMLATGNRRGLSLARGLDIVADSASGRLATELQRLRNDIKWNADLPGAFEAFGDRLVSPTLTRTVKLLAEGSRATSDLYLVLDVAATDIAERVRLRRERRRTLQTYLVIVVVGFLVYLLVVLLLAANFLEPVEAASASVATAGAAASGPVSLAAIPVEKLRVVLFHSALIQGFGSGLLAGKLAENSIYSGLKYGIGLVVVAVIAFTVV